MKKILALFMAAVFAVSFAGVSAFAWDQDGELVLGDVYNSDEDKISDFTVASGKVTGDSIRPGKTYYFMVSGLSEAVTGLPIPSNDLTDSDLFTFKLDRDENGTMIDSVSVTSKSFSGTRENYIKIVLKDMAKTDEKKVSFDVYFKAKKDDTASTIKWNSGDIISARFQLWVDNERADGEDADIDTGEGVVFKPVANELNTVTWGGNEEVASLEFDANSDADKFYAKLSTKTDSDIYSEYGDPVDADLYFRTFVGAPAIDSTSRATLTLYNPWSDYYDDDDDYEFDPREAYIYLVDSDGYLEDITDRFTYADEDKTPAGIDGWQVRVRSLGTYVISDTQLDAGSGYYDEPVDYPDTTPAPAPKPGPAPAPTGSHDFVGLACAFAALSVGAVIITRKRNK